MSLIRPEAKAALFRWREVLAAAAAMAAGGWLVWLGGWVLTPTGLGLIALGLAWGVLAQRRIRFAQGGAAPGIVEVDEGQVGYLGPAEGGFVSLQDLVELRLIHLRGQRFWRMKQADGQVLLIPVAAQGAERLFDAFAALPGMDTQALVTALETPRAPSSGARDIALAGDGAQIGPVIWRRATRVALT